jgi:hypothetical protein
MLMYKREIFQTKKEDKTNRTLSSRWDEYYDYVYVYTLPIYGGMTMTMTDIIIIVSRMLHSSVENTLCNKLTIKIDNWNICTLHQLFPKSRFPRLPFPLNENNFTKLDTCKCKESKDKENYIERLYRWTFIWLVKYRY